MADSVDFGRIPSSIPWAAPWLDGIYRQLDAPPGPPKALCWLSARATPWLPPGLGAGEVIAYDVERGDADALSVGSAVKVRRARGLSSVIYCQESSWLELYEQLEEYSGGPCSHWWVARWETVNAPAPSVPGGAWPQLRVKGREITATAWQFAGCTDALRQQPGYDTSLVDLSTFPLH